MRYLPQSPDGAGRSSRVFYLSPSPMETGTFRPRQPFRFILRLPEPHPAGAMTYPHATIFWYCCTGSAHRSRKLPSHCRRLQTSRPMFLADRRLRQRLQHLHGKVESRRFRLKEMPSQQAPVCLPSRSTTPSGHFSSSNGMDAANCPGGSARPPASNQLLSSGNRDLLLPEKLPSIITRFHSKYITTLRPHIITARRRRFYYSSPRVSAFYPQPRYFGLGYGHGR